MGLIVLCLQLQDRPCNFWMIPENIRPRRAVSRRCVMQLEVRSQLAPPLLTPHPLWMKDVSGEAKVERRLVLQPHCPLMQAWPTPTITRSYIMPPCYSISTWNVFSSPVRQGLSHSQEFHSSGLYRHVAIYAKSLKWCTCVWANSSWKLLIWCSCCRVPITCTCDSFSLDFFHCLPLTWDRRWSSLETQSGCMSVGTIAVSSASAGVPQTVEEVPGNGQNSVLRLDQSDTAAL